MVLPREPASRLTATVSEAGTSWGGGAGARSPWSPCRGVSPDLRSPAVMTALSGKVPIFRPRKYEHAERQADDRDAEQHHQGRRAVHREVDRRLLGLDAEHPGLFKPNSAHLEADAA